MLRRTLILLLLLAMVPLCWPERTVEPALAWGFYGHKRINRMASFTLPPEMFPFYKRHIDFISDHAGGSAEKGCQQGLIR